MSVTFLRTQQKEEPAGFKSNTVGYLNPVWYQFRQSLGTFTAVADLGSGTIRVSSVDATSSNVQIGDKIRLSGSVYTGVEVGTVTAISSGVSMDMTGIVFNGDDSGYWSNLSLQKNAHIETRLFTDIPSPPNFQNPSFDAGEDFWNVSGTGLEWNFSVPGKATTYTVASGNYQTEILGQPILLSTGTIVRININKVTKGTSAYVRLVSDKPVSTDYALTVSTGLQTIDLLLTEDVTNLGVQFFFTDTWSIELLDMNTVLLASIKILSKTDSSWFPSPNLLGYVDLQSELRSLFYNRDTLDYTGLYQVLNSARPFQFQYREIYWDRNNVKVIGAWVDINENCLAVPARKQLKEQWGNNLLDYVLKTRDAAGAGVQDFINGEFNDSLSPWLQTPESSGALWSYFSDQARHYLNVSKTLYQEVNVQSGLRRLNFDAINSSGLTSTIEVWAFNDPNTYLTTGTLVYSNSIPAQTTLFFNQELTFPNAIYTGFRANGQMFLDNCFFPDAQATGGTPGKFLERFTQPVIWGDVPSPVSFCIDKNSEALIPDLSMHIDWLDQDGIVIFSKDDQLGALKQGAYTYLIKDVPPNAVKVVVYAYVTGDLPNIVSELLTFRRKEFCSPAIMLEWQNSLGGFDQHVFGIRQEVTLQGTDAPVVQVYEPDIENSQGDLFRDGVPNQSTLLLYDDFVPTSEVIWLHELKTSRQVRVIFPNGTTIYCVVADTQTTLRTRTTYTQFTVTIRLPDNFNPSLIDTELIPEVKWLP